LTKRNWAYGRKALKSEGGYHRLYASKRWKINRLHQLTLHPLCAECMRGNYVRAATVVHHLQDHKGDEYLFFHSPLESLCKSCHDAIKYGSKHHGCDLSGKPYKTRPIYIDHNAVAGGK
jgi:hypothetical protein